MHRIRYAVKIRKRGWFGIPYTVWKIRTAHVDEQRWQCLKRQPFSISGMMLWGCARAE